MSAFESLVGATGLASLLEIHGETVTYRPRTGATYSVSAIIDRGPLEPRRGMRGAQERLEYQVIITIPRGSITARPVIGADEIDLLKRVDDTSTTRMRITTLIEDGQVGGAWVFGLG